MLNRLNNNIIKTQYSRLIDEKSESVEELIERVVIAISKAENTGDGKCQDYKAKFKKIILNNYFIPSGRILNNAGSKQSQTASCFVLPLKDNFSSIFDTLKLAANCHRLGGGTGFNFSKLREKGAKINSSEASGASGPVSWIKLFNSETSVVMAGGKRRGANIGILSVYHPDIIEFINCKNDFGLKNFNISILIDDSFMSSLYSNSDVNLVSPNNKKVVRKESAKNIWENIIKQIYKTGDPGVLFTDTINKGNPVKKKLGDLEIANPCGEQIMYSYESSFLGSINLLSFYDRTNNDLLWNELKDVIYLGVRFLDNAIDVNKYPSKRIENVSKSYRRIGLGIMGFADLLVKLKIPYDSNECLELINKIGNFLKTHSNNASEELANEKGAFPQIKYSRGITRRRNIAITAIAPTGTISMVANCSSGIEPRFAAYYNKDVIEENGIDNIDPLLLDTLISECNISEVQSREAIKDGSYKMYLSDRQKNIYKYAHEIDYSWHVKILSQWQKFIDNGISKTVNVPNNISYSEIDEVLRLSFEKGCKGITIYRQGSHRKDLLSTNEEQQIIQSKEKSKYYKTLHTV